MRIEIDSNVNPLTRYDDYWQPIGSLRKPNVVFRHAERKTYAGRKLIRCPSCREVLLDIHKDTRVQLYRVNRGKAFIPKVHYRKCYFCKDEVGIKII